VSDIDLKALRAKFSAAQIGKLPRITCGDCSRGSCGQHPKTQCKECGNYISPRHIHIDFVGHADVTMRLCDVDPEWTWKPHATDPDPEILKAAMATGNADIVQAVIDNAPPKFERTSNGNAVGLWLWLTIGGSTKPGVGSCPANQADAEKVLIGDAIRNAAMRFGVATEQWAKGERAAPGADNPTGPSGQAARNAPRPPQGKVTRPAQPAAPAVAPVADEELGDWGITIGDITCLEDAEKVDTQLRAAYEAKTIDAARANLLRGAVRTQLKKVSAKAGASA